MNRDGEIGGVQGDFGTKGVFRPKNGFWGIFKQRGKIFGDHVPPPYGFFIFGRYAPFCLETPERGKKGRRGPTRPKIMEELSGDF